MSSRRGIRLIEESDLPEIQKLMEAESLEFPRITETTLVYEEDGKIVAFVACRDLSFAYLWFDEKGTSGKRAGYLTLKQMEFWLKCFGKTEYAVGVSQKAATMQDLAEKFGFQTHNELLFVKALANDPN